MARGGGDRTLKGGSLPWRGPPATCSLFNAVASSHWHAVRRAQQWSYAKVGPVVSGQGRRRRQLATALCSGRGCSPKCVVASPSTIARAAHPSARQANTRDMRPRIASEVWSAAKGRGSETDRGYNASTERRKQRRAGCGCERKGSKTPAELAAPHAVCWALHRALCVGCNGHAMHTPRWEQRGRGLARRGSSCGGGGAVEDGRSLGGRQHCSIYRFAV